VFAFVPVLLRDAIGLAGILGGKIWHDGATLPQFKLEIAPGWSSCCLLVLAPLFFFVTQLADAKRTVCGKTAPTSPGRCDGERRRVAPFAEPERRSELLRCWKS